jgi:2-polyprenyl-6-methoxyphenol hydroxylase-like FAD-dependent oxidoreductase
MNILLIGGGIGGLVAALRLHEAGHQVRVFESVPAIRPLGVGINLLPHAVKVLTGLGLAEALAAVGVATAELAYFNKFGQEIWAEPRGRAAGYHWPQYSIHRGQLQQVLLAAVRARLGTDAVQTGYHLAAFEETDGQVVARFIDRATGTPLGDATGDALIGADGIHSVVRKHFYPDEGDPRFSGRVLWRAVSEAPPFRTGRSMVMIGHADQKFVAYPIGTTPAGNSLINWIAELYVGGDEPPMKRDWNRRARKEDFAPPFAAWRFDWLDVPALIGATDEVYEFPMIDRDPVPRWSFGRVTLLGDAAHPMYPIGSNGASQAILDAAALARAFEGATDVPTTLRQYEAQRLGPTAQIVLNNRQQGPERVMQLAEERAPQGFDHVESVIPRSELEEISRQYKIAAGFDRETLNQTT